MFDKFPCTLTVLPILCIAAALMYSEMADEGRFITTTSSMFLFGVVIAFVCDLLRRFRKPDTALHHGVLENNVWKQRWREFIAPYAHWTLSGVIANVVFFAVLYWALGMFR